MPLGFSVATRRFSPGKTVKGIETGAAWGHRLMKPCHFLGEDDFLPGFPGRIPSIFGEDDHCTNSGFLRFKEAQMLHVWYIYPTLEGDVGGKCW